MIEYIYNAIRATAGEDIPVTAKITDDAGECLEGCMLCLFDKDSTTKLTGVTGVTTEGLTQFVIKGADTAGLRGRYWYAVCDRNDNSISFKVPIYFK